MLGSARWVGLSASLLSVFIIGCSSSEPSAQPEQATTPDAGSDTASTLEASVGDEAGSETGACLKQVTGAGRTTATACAARVRPPTDADAGVVTDGGGDECTSDAQCTAKENGRCSVKRSPSGATSRACTYDACSSDADCGTSGVCGCELGFGEQHVCLSNSNCRLDSDCGSGQRCMLSLPQLLTLPFAGDDIETGSEVVAKHATSAYDEALGYFCTTPNDTCDGACYGSGRCTYDMGKKHWVWGYQY